MPFPKKLTDAQVQRLYEEFSAQDKDLKTFCEERGIEHYDAIRVRFDRLEKRRAKGLPDTRPKAPSTGRIGSVAAAVVADATDVEIRDKMEARLAMMKAVEEAAYRYYAKKGMSIDQIKKLPIHQAVISALDKESEFDELAEENRQLKDALRMYAQEVDPLLRLKSAIQLITEFLEMATIAELAGFNIKGSGIIDYYQNLLESYMKGEEA